MSFHSSIVAINLSFYCLFHVSSPISPDRFPGCQVEISRRWSLGLLRRRSYVMYIPGLFLIQPFPLQSWAIAFHACRKRRGQRACTIVRARPNHQNGLTMDWLTFLAWSPRHRFQSYHCLLCRDRRASLPAARPAPRRIPSRIPSRIRSLLSHRLIVALASRVWRGPPDWGWQMPWIFN